MTTLPTRVQEIAGWPELELASRIFDVDLVFAETPGAGTYSASVTVPAGVVVLLALPYVVSPWAADTVVLDFGSEEAPASWLDSVDLKGDASAAGPAALRGGFRAAEDTVLTASLVTTGAGGSTGEARLRLVYSPPAPAGGEIAAAKEPG